MQLANQRIVVVGLGQTGVSVARFAASRGARVVVTDSAPAERLATRLAELGPIADLQLGGHRLETFTGADLIVMSPGVPELAETRAARAAGVPVIGEIELAYRFFHPDATLIAITGTNGKSTTTALTGALCSASGRPTFCGGNLGNQPLIEAVGHPANAAGGYLVAEVAGFMLETCTSFGPKVAVCLNITDDHLDRYGTLETYVSMKARIFRWQTEFDAAIANRACVHSRRAAESGRGRLFLFDRSGEVERGAFLSPDQHEIVLRESPAGEQRFPTGDLALVGTHNLENAMAAYLAASLANVPGEAIRRGAAAFRPLEHRMEPVGERGGVVFFDDSKATNVASVAASMRGFPRPVILIAGGLDKGGSYRPMFEALDGVARALVLIGMAAPLIRRAAMEYGVRYPVVDAATMEAAVKLAASLAGPGDAVVLSPACASYDMFANFAARGMAFRAAVAALRGTHGA